MTEVLYPEPVGIKRAAKMLRDGALVAFGTETVYGLGADATNPAAVAAIFEAKERPRFNPLICHYPSETDAFRDVVADERARRVARLFWPGPLTLILPRQPSSRVALLTGAGLATLAVRVPSHTVALSLLQETGLPIAAPSANRSGKVSPTTAKHVLDTLDGRIAAIVDSGPCNVGLESTVLDLSQPDPFLLRPGAVTLEDLEERIGPVRLGTDHSRQQELRSPGMMLSHYAPTLPVRLGATSVSDDEVLLAFGSPLSGARLTFQLSHDGNVAEAAARLFDGLRWLDAAGAEFGVRGIAVMNVPEIRLGRAINDRLRRAAAPRGE